MTALCVAPRRNGLRTGSASKLQKLSKRELQPSCFSATGPRRPATDMFRGRHSVLSLVARHRQSADDSFGNLL
eukprot:6204513-Pleurochrysis_carterae.AAC.2